MLREYALGIVVRKSADPRVARSKAAVLAAAADELFERGFAGASVDRIASRSGVAKTTIYRHWPSRGALLADTCRTWRHAQPEPDTSGDLRTDLVTVLSGLARGLQTGAWPRVLASLIERAEHDAELAGVHREAVRELRRPLHRILESGVRNGELPRDLDLDLAAAELAGPLFYRRLVSHERVDPGIAAAIVDRFLAAARTPARRR